MTGEWDRMMRYFSSMKSAGVQADVYTFTSLIRACQSCGNRWQNAFVFFNQMRPAGKAVPTGGSHICKSIVNAPDGLVLCCQCSLHCTFFVSEVPWIKLLEGSASNSNASDWSGPFAKPPTASLPIAAPPPTPHCALTGVQPNVQAYTALVSVCNHAGQPAEALRALYAMDAAGVQLDAVAFNSVMATCAGRGQWESAWAVMATMQRSGVEPTARSHNLLLSACERAGQAERALEVFQRMQRRAKGAPAQSLPSLMREPCFLASWASLWSCVPRLSERYVQGLRVLGVAGPWSRCRLCPADSLLLGGVLCTEA